MTEIAGRQVARNDLGVMAAGAAALVFSLLPYYGLSYKVAGADFSASFNAWHGYATLGMLLLVAAAGVVAARVFGGVTLPTLPLGWHVIVAGLAGLGTFLVILRALTYPHIDVPGGSYGVKWGGYLLFLAAIAETVFAVMALRDSGESVSFDRGTTDTPPPAAP
ncbi:MAG: hypothetical protein JJD92_05965 [Frankiaceae bacterium]|nr:hypothetical protein [Frankiaceae bacterium]